MTYRPREYPPMPMHPSVSLQKRNSIHVSQPMQIRNSIVPEIRDAKSLQDVSAHHSSDIVHLNVGGKRYSTFYETLARSKSAHFSHFVRIDETSGKVLLYHRNFVEDAQHAIFVNRDGDLFSYVLQYMRDGKKMVLPEDVYLLRQILRESEFFGLEGLRRIVTESLRYEEKKKEESDDNFTSLKNTVNQISQSMYYNGFKR